MKENRMLPIGTETFRIFVDEAEDGVIRGRVSGETLRRKPYSEVFHA